ncbi:MAG: 3-octaprenyl-4-hydroxybenzoate carboxy-lyase [Deltaproteobacteria bacterium]|nr:MAG: 3-octaprenyl-4-hydroxybenzoate carboxy-lyase [Deltaproteobacteria bacterium]
MKRIIVGISGASGAIYGIRLLEVLRDLGVETHLVITDPAKRIIQTETTFSLQEVIDLSDHYYHVDDVGAPIASGTFPVDGMVVAPCSIKTLSAIAHCYATNLLVRAADVTLKERRKLLLLVRESPLHKGHLDLMLKATELGAIIVPPVVSFYNHPKTLDDVIDDVIRRILRLLGLDQ